MKAQKLIQMFVNELQKRQVVVAQGRFGADRDVAWTNHGLATFTIHD